MASDILGLFTSPEQYQLAQQQAQDAEALQYARLDPRAKASYGFYRAGQQLGGAIGGALGGVDPQLQKITQRQQLLGMIDPANLDSYAKAIQAALQTGDQEAAFLLRNEMVTAQKQALITRKTTAEAQKAELTIKQEQELRDELSRLPQNATEADILSVVTKYGSPDKVLGTLQASTDKAAQRDLLASQQSERLAQQERLAKEKLEAQAEQARKDNEARLERARENNASKADLAKIAAEGRQAQNVIMNSIRESSLQLRQEAASEKKLASERQQQGLVASFDAALDTLNTISIHPGKKSAVGFGGAQLSMIPGTDAAGFAAQLETFKAQTFLPQVQALKGMGALSNAEGQKLEAAVGALTQSMKQSEFDSQIVKIKSYLQTAKDRVGKNIPTQPSMSPTQAPAPKGKVIKFSDLP